LTSVLPPVVAKDESEYRVDLEDHCDEP